MKTLTSSHESKLALSILEKCFLENANFKFIFGKAINGWRFQAFLKCFVSFAITNKGAYISNDRSGIAFIFPIRTYRQKKKPIQWWRALYIIPMKRILRVQSLMKQSRTFEPQEPHLFFMLLAVGNEREGLSTIIEIRDEAFKMSEALQLPIYAQTSNKRTKLLYERYGFSTYGTIAIPETNESLYFLKRATYATAI